MKRGVVLSIDVFIASIVLIMFMTTFFFYKIDSNVNEKIKSDRISDVLFTLEDEFKSGDSESIESSISAIMPDNWKYQLVINYHNKDGDILNTLIFGSDLGEIIAVDKRGFVVMDGENIQSFGIAEMKVGR